MKLFMLLLLTVSFHVGAETDCSQAFYPWLPEHESHLTLADAIEAPEGYRRLPEQPFTFGHWLQCLPIRADQDSPICDYRQQVCDKQNRHALIIDINLGNVRGERAKFQDCGGTVVRLLGEYRWWLAHVDRASAQHDMLFLTTSGDVMSWHQWHQNSLGYREGKYRLETFPRTSYEDSPGSYNDYRNFLSYATVWVSTASLAFDLAHLHYDRHQAAAKAKTDAVKDKVPQRGDLLVRPRNMSGTVAGHVYVIADIAVPEDDPQNTSRWRLLLVEGNRPGVETHVQKNHADRVNPAWFAITSSTQGLQVSIARHSTYLLATTLRRIQEQPYLVRVQRHHNPYEKHWLTPLDKLPARWPQAVVPPERFDETVSR